MPITGWSKERGDLRIAHFLGLHAFQGILLLGVLLTRLHAGTAKAILTVAAVVWLVATFGLAKLALDGVSPLP